MTTTTREIKIAILDLYNGIANQAIKSFEHILQQYEAQHRLNLIWQTFKVREANELPDVGFDIYISSGGPGNPFSEDADWDKNYFRLIYLIETHNASDSILKKHVLFICHSFQLLCRRYQLGEVSLRNIPSFGVVPVELTSVGKTDMIFKNMPSPFYAVDSRSWQVVNPNMATFEKLGAKILAIEQERPDNLPRALMAIRLNDYFVATQFHPEMGPEVMRTRLLMKENKQQVIEEHGEAGYQTMLDGLGDPGKLALTFNTVIASFLYGALMNL